jgi:hypothetical protein
LTSSVSSADMDRAQHQQAKQPQNHKNDHHNPPDPLERGVYRRSLKTHSARPAMMITTNTGTMGIVIGYAVGGFEGWDDDCGWGE